METTEPMEKRWRIQLIWDNSEASIDEEMTLYVVLEGVVGEDDGIS